MIIQMQLNETIREICLPSEVLNIYPKHCEWVEKCISESRTCFLAQENQMPIGCAIVKISRKNVGLLKLCFLYMLPDYRHKGYARSLIAAIEEYAIINGLSGIYTTVNPKTDSVERFISSCGYKKISRTKYGDIVFQRIFYN